MSDPARFRFEANEVAYQHFLHLNEPYMALTSAKRRARRKRRALIAAGLCAALVLGGFVGALLNTVSGAY